MPLKTTILPLFLICFCIKVTGQNRELSQSTDKVCFGEPVRLTATGCDKTVVWSNGMQGNNILLDAVTETNTYSAACMEGENVRFNYDNSLLVEALEKPRTPYLMCNDDEIKRGRSTKIKTFGCVGAVKWSNGETGREIKVTPDKTTTYTAVCTNEANCTAEPISRTIVVYQNKSDLEPHISWKYACSGESVLMSAEGCSGNYVWYKNELILGEVSKTEEIHRGSSVEVTAGGDNVFYTARCQFADCLGNESNRLQIAYLAKIDTPEVTKTLGIDSENPVAVDLTSTLTKPMTSGGIFEFRAVNDVNASLIGNPTQINENGTYYVRERSRQGNCVSDMAEIIVTNEANQQGTTPPTVATAGNENTTSTPSTQPNQVIQSTDTGAAFASVEPNAALDYLGIPGGFSPNGDNINDVFFIKNLAETQASLRVYNRYGHLVFDAPIYNNDWSGTPNTGIFKNSSMGLPDGTYYYSLKLTDGRQKVSFLTIAR